MREKSGLGVLQSVAFLELYQHHRTEPESVSSMNELVVAMLALSIVIVSRASTGIRGQEALERRGERQEDPQHITKIPKPGRQKLAPKVDCPDSGRRPLARNEEEDNVAERAKTCRPNMAV